MRWVPEKARVKAADGEKVPLFDTLAPLLWRELQFAMGCGTPMFLAPV